MVSATERVMARRQISAIIKSDPVFVILRRRPREATPGGGWRYTGGEVPLPPQEVTLIPFKRRMTDFKINTELGEVTDLPYIMVGFYDLDVEEDDQFTYEGKDFVVKEIDFKDELRVSAQVNYRG